MRCFICDSALSEVHSNSDFEDYEPCGTCLVVIKDTVSGWIDRPSADEDDWSDDLGLDTFEEPEEYRLE